MGIWDSIFGKKGGASDAAQRRQEAQQSKYPRDKVDDGKKEESDADRRKYPRAQTDVGTFLCLPGGRRIKARILDISQGGVKVQVQTTLNIGAQLELALRSEEDESKVLVFIKWELYQDGDYIYGAEFASINPTSRAIITKYLQSGQS